MTFSLLFKTKPRVAAFPRAALDVDTPGTGGARGSNERLVFEGHGATQVAILIICVSLVLRLGLMLLVGLGVDESYTLANAQTPALSYFDHPPLHQWIAELSLSVFGFTPWVRLPFVLLFAGTGWFLFDLTRHLYNATAGLWALLVLNLSAFFTISAGEWVVPDGPLLLCLAAAAAEMGRILMPRGAASGPWQGWLRIGIWVGLAGLSKYSAALTLLGFLLCVASIRPYRRWLTHPAPYAGAAVALILLAPVLLWNARNGWVSLSFQSARGLPSGHVKLMHCVAMVGGQIALLGPWLVVPLLLALRSAVRDATWDRRSAFLLSLALPPIVVFTLLPLWGAQGMPHWTMPGWLFTFPLLGAWLARGGRPWLRPCPWSAASAAAFALVIGIGVSHATWGWVRDVWPAAFKGRDPTLESLSWDPLRASAVVAARPIDFIVTTHWMEGAKLAAAFGGSVPVLVFSDDPRQFAFSHDAARFVHKNAIIVLGPHSNGASFDPSRYFAQVEPFQTVWLGRRGRPEVALLVARADDMTAPYPLPYPHRSPPKTGPLGEIHP